MRRTFLAVLVAFLTLFAVVGCDDDRPSTSPGKPDLLLSSADVAPLVPSSVTKVTELPTGTQYYSCSEERHTLSDNGWSFVGRDLRNTAANWAVYSVVLDNPDEDSASQVAQFREQVDQCSAAHGAHLVVFNLGKDRFAYRSITPGNRVDTVRAYALVGDHRLVQVTVLGLNNHSAPDRIGSLVDRAVAKAG